MSHGRFVRRLLELKQGTGSRPGLPFSEVLTEERIAAMLAEWGVLYRERIYTPCVTLWMFLGQVLSPDHSCREVVARLLAFRTVRGLSPCSAGTGSYCEARERLPRELLRQLVRQTGRELREQALDAWRLHGRRILLMDGSTVSMPDTRQNAAAFGKAENQYGPVGFPLARIVVLLCLATGAVLEMAIGPYRGKKSGELSLFRARQEALERGDLLLGDRLFCSWCDIAGLRERGVDVVFRQNAQRLSDFRRGRKLGREDHLVAWHKPRRRPDGISEEAFAALPATLLLREVRVRVGIPGFRVRSLIVVTTLTDPHAFTARDLANLYRQRWHAEVDLRSIKDVMQMDVLRCQSPEMVCKELWAHLLAYNLLRGVMCAAAAERDLLPRQVSFKGALQLFNVFHQYILVSSPEQLTALSNALLAAVAQHRVANRPNRCEPRKRKRAAKAYPRLKHSREQERNLCRQNRIR